MEIRRLVSVWAVVFAVLAASGVATDAQGQRAQRASHIAPAAARPVPTSASLRPGASKIPRKLTGRQLVSQIAARSKILATRAVTLPTHFWPLKQISTAIAHGEPLTGLTPKSAVKIARLNAKANVATVIGRLAPDLKDIWSVRGAEKSFANLIDEIAAAKAADGQVSASVAIDPYSFGYELAGMSQADRERISMAGMLRIARRAKQKGVDLEMDMLGAHGMKFSLEAATTIVNRFKIPVRLAVPARYKQSEQLLRDWAAVGRRNGVKVGVRLVKGSVIEADEPGAINTRTELLAHYKDMITLAMEHSADIDVAVATHNEDIFNHAQSEAKRTGADYSVHVIRGVNPKVQNKMRAAGRISREYVSYGVDAPGFGIDEMIGTYREKRTLERRGVPRDQID